MPLLCIEKRRSPTELDDNDTDEEDDDRLSQDPSIWQDIPDSILLHIFSFLDVPNLGHVAQSCKTWNRVSLDESLWKDLLHSEIHVTCGQLAQRKRSWREEVKRVKYHVPTVLTETLTEHTDEVLHVSFSHNGKLFSTTSKDATLKVWAVGYPTALKYSKDFRELLAWDFTQFSSFNESDTMVLVSSVKSTHVIDRRGYMAILSLIHDFEILRVVTMDPSQLFGAWLDDTTFLGGSLEISLDRFATTVQIEAHEVTEIFSPLPLPAPALNVEESSGKSLFTFSSETASLIKFLTVANIVKKDCRDVVMSTSPCLEDLNTNEQETAVKDELSNSDKGVNDCIKDGNSDSEELLAAACKGKADKPMTGSYDEMEHSCVDLELNMEEDHSETVNIATADEPVCRNCLKQIYSEKTVSFGEAICDCLYERHDVAGSQVEGIQRPAVLELGASCSESLDNWTNKEKDMKQLEKNLILVTGEFAVALHQIGFKNVPPYTKESVLASGATPMDSDNPEGFMVVNYSNNDIHIVHRQQKLDTPDHLIDLFGHVTGLCLTPDQRYLFINCRPWVGDVDRTDPWATPDLSPNIEVRIIDLYTLKDLGVRYKGHKGFSPPNMCCFVFLDVSQDFVASGSEDARGYLWDRHYQSLLASYEHEQDK
ncbi:F-box/WD repeat-containing protein 5-like isoform X2 [Mercenaria mercenaria]|uniref:F-box/WD repeat-containing protein 5-like isoform X2 n=1 Tax=Mercenaria mercenaria TaxID=6596 RepID=UPI00234F660D|nr:F-box/WD repeat-containing protein 5-like isoform X2 [Mercenaria mercenaria]